MDERKRNSHHSGPWDDSVYGTGPTRPPKDRGGLIALLLVLIIFLVGIITVLGILNIRLFRQLNRQEDNDLSISFTVESTTPMETEPEPTEEPTIPPQTEESLIMELEQTPIAIENVPTEGGISLQEIYRRNIGSVVSISCSLPGGSSTGTGVIMSGDGYIVTNSHVVENAASITVQLTDDRIFPAMLVGSDAVTDLAVLFIEAESLTAAEFGDSGNLQVGDTVAAIGDPLGVEFRGTMTDGIVSAINRDMVVEGRTMTLIQTNAALNSGNSGGPLINCYGQVIGINTMKIGAFTDSAGVEGLGFAIPSATVKDVVDQLISQGYVSGRPTIGIEGDTLSTFYQHYYRLPAGLYITGVEPGTDAYSQGIEDGDILISINDKRITSMDELNTILYNLDVGDTVDAVIYRGGQQYLVKLELTEDKG